MQSIKLPYFNSFFKKTKKISIWQEQINENNVLHDTLEFIDDNQEVLLNSALFVLFNLYPKLRKEYGYTEDELQRYMPEITSINDFSYIIEPTTIVIHPKSEKDHLMFGLIFDCLWDDHGIGISFDNYEVIKAGNADVAM